MYICICTTNQNAHVHMLVLHRYYICTYVHTTRASHTARKFVSDPRKCPAKSKQSFNKSPVVPGQIHQNPNMSKSLLLNSLKLPSLIHKAL